LFDVRSHNTTKSTSISMVVCLFKVSYSWELNWILTHGYFKVRVFLSSALHKPERYKIGLMKKVMKYQPRNPDFYCKILETMKSRFGFFLGFPNISMAHGVSLPGLLIVLARSLLILFPAMLTDVFVLYADMFNPSTMTTATCQALTL